MSGEALQIAVKKREVKSKGEKENIPIWMESSKKEQGEIRKSYSVINSRKWRKNNRMGKTRYLFKKIRDTKGIFLAKMDWIKDRDGMDLTEAEDTKKMWQEYMEELYKKDLHNPDNQMVWSLTYRQQPRM